MIRQSRLNLRQLKVFAILERELNSATQSESGSILRWWGLSREIVRSLLYVGVDRQYSFAVGGALWVTRSDPK
jgi:hypothetical protein